MSAHDLNGSLEWHERLRDEPAPTPDLPDQPTPLELARAYAALALAYRSQWPLVVEGLQYLHGALLGTKGTVERIERRMTGTPEPHRPPLPSLSEYTPDLTPAGGIRIPPAAWEEVRVRLADTERALADALQAEKLARAVEVALEAKAKRQRERVVFYVTIGTAVGGLAAWLLTHFAHL